MLEKLGMATVESKSLTGMTQAVGSEMTINKANKKNISDNLKCNRVWEAN